MDLKVSLKRFRNASWFNSVMKHSELECRPEQMMSLSTATTRIFQ